MRFATVDLILLVVYLGAVLVLGVWASRRAAGGEESYFLAGRKLPWWMAGASLMATSFSIDTPLGIAGLVDEHGVQGVWFAWCFALGGAGMLGYAVFSELWRRSGVVTDAEFVELRYGGRGAAALRAVKALYFGVFLNAFTLAWILKAVTTLGEELLGRSPLWVLSAVLLLTLVYSMAAGLWGVVVSDLPQYVIVLGTMVLLAGRSLVAVGGPEGLESALAARYGAAGAAGRLAFAPSPGDAFFPTFLAYVLLLWWAHRNASAAGPVVQRLAACRDEREARRSTLFFTVGTFAVNYWPMIILALTGLALHPELAGEQAVARLFYEGLPPGLLGLVAAALLAAFMSTVDTHLNLGASYWVHDVVKRFLRPAASESELVRWGRASTALMLALAVALSFGMDSVAGAWQVLAALTAGYGPVTVARWFWWRVSAWSELSALIASGLASWAVGRWAPDLGFGAELATIVAICTPVWILVTLWGPAPAPAAVERFVRVVRPWGRWPRLPGVEVPALGPRLGLWLAGSVAVLASGFALGGWLLARPGTGAWSLVAVGGWLGFVRLGPASPEAAPEGAGEGDQKKPEAGQ